MIEIRRSTRRTSRLDPFAHPALLLLFALAFFQLQVLQGDARPPPAPYLRGPATKLGIVPTYNQKIVGGTIVMSAGTFGWMAHIRGPYLCGGSMIAPRILLTAAHCAIGTQAAQWTAFTYRLNIYTTSVYNIIYPVTKVYIHPAYNDNTMVNDVAVFILGPPGPYTEWYPPVFISLNREPATPVAGETLKALGHGTIYSGGPLGVNLMEVDLPALSTTQCMNFVGPYGSYGSSVNHPSMMCAGNGTGFDTCQGDSGGPLVVKRGDKWVQVGITSWGFGCGNYPGVYTRLSNVTSWIDNVVNAEGGYNGLVSATPTPTVTKSTTTSRTFVTGTGTVICASPTIAINDQKSTVVDIQVPLVGEVVEAKLSLNLYHSYPWDLHGQLINPQGVSARLFKDTLCHQERTLSLSFDDESQQLQVDCLTASTAQQTIKPMTPLSALLGRSEGIWKISISDEHALDSGMFNSYCLELKVAGAPIATNATLTTSDTQTTITRTSSATKTATTSTLTCPACPAQAGCETPTPCPICPVATEQSCPTAEPCPVAASEPSVTTIVSVSTVTETSTSTSTATVTETETAIRLQTATVYRTAVSTFTSVSTYTSIRSVPYYFTRYVTRTATAIRISTRTITRTAARARVGAKATPVTTTAA